MKQSEGLYILFKQYDQTKPNLPPSITSILFPNKTDNEDINFDTTSLSPYSNESILRTKALIRHFSDSSSINGKNSPVVSHPKTA